MIDVPPSQQLEERLRHAEALIRSYKATSMLHSMRADFHSADASHIRYLLYKWNKGIFSRVGRVIRVFWLLSNGQSPYGSLEDTIRRIKNRIARDGVRSVAHIAAQRGIRYLKRRSQAKKKRTVPAALASGLDVNRKVTRSAYEIGLKPKFLLVADLVLPQCAKYRVWQRKEELELLGWDVDVISWRNSSAALSALQTCQELIIYRAPAYETVKTLIEEAQKLGICPWWEVDDLIFDAESYKENKNLASLSRTEQRDLLKGASLYLECLQLCGRGVASTKILGEAMLRAGAKEICIIENALDSETLSIADEILAKRPLFKSSDDIIIVYGSGSRAHDEDFRQCASGLAEAMDEEPRLKLRIVGELTLPAELRRLSHRVEFLGGRDYAGYLALLAEADFSLAPLEATLFNDAKSNIKFLEAAILKLPSICSPTDTFRQVVENGQNGFLANDHESWKSAILTLASDTDLRLRLGEQAYKDALEHYKTEKIAQSQVFEYFPLPQNEGDASLRVMAVNTFFAPRSFGGATVVAEEMVRRLSQRGLKLSVFTSGEPIDGLFRSSTRYDVKDTPVLASMSSKPMDPVESLDNPQSQIQFEDWLKAFQADVVHFHSIQGLGVGLLQVCIERGVPFIVTLHDAWWLCERQFMVKPNGHYCFQRHIDLKMCCGCVPDALHLELRQNMMLSLLHEAAILLTPSESHRQLYLENGFSPDKVRVNKNGFNWPAVPRLHRTPGSPIRFGYVGGPDVVKGFHLLRKVFENLNRDDWELVLIDNTLNLGFSSMNVADWKVKGKIVTREAYNDDTRDAFFNSIDVLLFPSQWMESYGLTVREALSRDVWVVSTAPGAQAEDIADGINGSLIPLDGRDEYLQAAIENILKNPENFDKYKNPLKESLSTFEGQAKELEAFLREAASTRIPDESMF